MDVTLDMSLERLTNLTEAIANTDAPTFKQVTDLIASGAGTVGAVTFSVDGTTLVALTTAGMKAVLNQTAAEILTKLLTVDGAGSLLDADLLDGLDSLLFTQQTGATGAAKLATGTTAQRPGGAVEGYLRRNSTTSQVEVFNGSTWEDVGEGGAVGGGTDAIFLENGQNVTTNYTITAGKNALSAGPIIVDSGATVTVPTGVTWTVV